MMRIAHHALGPQRRQQYRSETLTVFESKKKSIMDPHFFTRNAIDFSSIIAYKTCKNMYQTSNMKIT